MENPHRVLHGNKCTMVHGVLDVTLSPSTRGGFNTKLEAWQSIRLSLTFRNIITCDGGDLNPNIVVIHQHRPLSFYTKLEGPNNCNLDFYFPTNIERSLVVVVNEWRREISMEIDKSCPHWGVQFRFNEPKDVLTVLKNYTTFTLKLHNKLKWIAIHVFSLQKVYLYHIFNN
jgi:hypothetical protein